MNTHQPSPNRSLTLWSLAGLALGLLLGTLAHSTSSPFLDSLSPLFEPLGQIWMRALQMIVLPLVVTQLVVAVISSRNGAVVGRLGGAAVMLFVILLGIGAVFTIAVSPPLLEWADLDHEAAASLETTIPESARAAAEGRSERPTFTGWLVGLVPTNPIRAFAEGNLLQIIVFTLFFAFAVTRIPSRPRRLLTGVFEGLARAMMVMVWWILRFTPLGVFALSLSFAEDAGLATAEILAQFAGIVSGLLLVFTLALYPIAILAGRVSPSAFAQSLYPAQLVAISTRSSLACLPALMRGADKSLKLPREISGFALPFSAATFKINRTVSSTFKLLFLANLFQIPLDPTRLLAFVVTVIILSFSSVGIPGGGASFKTLPAYLAAGVPIEGVVLLEAVDVIPDIFKTLINATGYMTVATILARLPGAAPAPRAALAPAALP